MPVLKPLSTALSASAAALLLLAGGVQASEPASAAVQDEAEETARTRILESPQMAEALAWYEQYFATSAEATDEQRNDFAAAIDAMTSVELEEFLSNFQQRRIRAQQRQMISEGQRAQILARIHGLRRQQGSGRPAASVPAFGGGVRQGTHGRYFGTMNRGATNSGQRLARINARQRGIISSARSRAWRYLSFARRW